MAYLDVTGLPLTGLDDQFGPAFSFSLERERGLSVLSDDGMLPSALVHAILGTGYFNGEVILNSRKIDPLPPKKRAVAVLGDVPGVIPGRTVRENIELAMKKSRAPVSLSEEVFLIDQMLSEGSLDGLADVKAKSLDHTGRTMLAALRLLIGGCDLMIIKRLPVPAFRSNGEPIWEPGFQLDALLELKNVLRDFRATWISTLTDSGCVHVLSDRVAIFSRNALIQEGSLRECLNAPANRLVADFLSFPRMNYKRIRIEYDGPFVMLRGGRYGFRVSEYIKRQLKSHEGEDVVIGIRPDDLNIRPYEIGDPTILNLARVTRVDSVPGGLVVRLDVEGDEWLALAGQNRTLYTGQLVELRPDPDRIYLFNPTNDSNILD